MEEKILTPKEYTDMRFAALEKLIDVTADLNKTAVDKAYDSIEDKLALLNELRRIVTDRDAMFSTKEITDKIDERVKLLELDRAKVAGMASQTTVIIFGSITIIGFVLTVISFFTK